MKNKLWLLLFLCFWPTLEITAQIENIDVFVEKAEIADMRLFQFLKSTIIQIALVNNFNPEYFEISVKSGLKSDCDLESPIAMSDSIYIVNATRCGTTLQYIYAQARSPTPVYVCFIDGIPIYVRASGSAQSWFKPLREKIFIGSFEMKKGDLLKLSICDDSIIWYIIYSPTIFRVVKFVDFGYSWLKNKETKKYLPGLPIKYLKNEYRVITPSLILDYLDTSSLPRVILDKEK